MSELITLLILIILSLSAYVKGTGVSAALGLLAFYLLALFLREHRVRKRLDFVSQLKSHRKELRSGASVVVDNTLLRYDSVVTTYYASIGVVFSSFRIPTHYRLASGEEHLESFFYSALCLVTGWWAFPSGPVLTIAVIRENLAGGEKIPVAYLIDGHLFAQAESSAPEAYFIEPEEKEEDSPLAQTGEGSKSQRYLKRAASQDYGSPDMETRIRNWDTPPPPGVVWAERLRKNWEQNWKPLLREALEESKKSKSLQELKKDHRNDHATGKKESN